jgi:hypothetical protein
MQGSDAKQPKALRNEKPFLLKVPGISWDSGYFFWGIQSFEAYFLSFIKNCICQGRMVLPVHHQIQFVVLKGSLPW